MTAELAEAGRRRLDGSDPGAARDAHPAIDILRDITRGGLAGLLVGIVLAGIGGRILMRAAAVLVPGSAGSVTENGNVVGRITLDGSLALVLFVGLFFGVVAGSLWVVIAPWLAERPGLRAAVAVPIALALGTMGLVDDRNPDFALLEHDPVVVGSLVLLVGLFGPALVLAERWLDGRLPRPGPGDGAVLVGYATVAVLGGLLTFAAVVPVFLGSRLVVSGLALVVVGLATLASWRLRWLRRPPAPSGLAAAARVALAIATINGLFLAGQEVAGALALG